MKSRLKSQKKQLILKTRKIFVNFIKATLGHKQNKEIHVTGEKK